MRHKPLFLQFLAYLLLRVLVGLITILPIFLVAALGRIWGWSFFIFSAYRRRLAIANLEQSFPRCGAAEIRSLASSVFVQFGQNVSLGLQAVTWGPERVKKVVDFAPGAAENFRPAIILGTSDNRFIDAYFASRLQKIGLTPIMRRRNGHYINVSAETMQHLEGGGAVIFFIDINWFVSKPIMVEFFCRPAATTRGPAHLLFDQPVEAYVLFLEARARNCYLLHIDPQPLQRQIDDREVFIQHHMQLFTSHLEKAIRRQPEQWLWFLPRWRSSDRQRYSRQQKP
jgi:lauroyl/myristoyl acyltransferase